MSDLTSITQAEAAIYRAEHAPHATDAQWNYFWTECQRRNLVPGVHVIFQVRSAKEYSRELGREIDVEKVVLITTIAALRLVAERSGKFAGYGRTTWHYQTETVAGFAPTFIDSHVPWGKAPHAVTVEGHRHGWSHPVYFTARLKTFHQNNAMWNEREEEQLAKCAEAGMLRMAAPEDCAGLFLKEELIRENLTGASDKVAPAEVVQPPKPTVAPAVNQTAAVVEPEQPKLETSRIPEVAQASAVAVEQAKKVQAPPTPAKPPIPTPRPAAPPVPKPVPPAAKVAPPVIPAPAASPVVPAAPAVGAETNIHGVAVTDNDLPENLRRQPERQEPVQDTVKEIAAVASAVERDKDPVLVQAAETLAPKEPIAAVAAPPTEGMDSETYQKLMGRSQKIVRKFENEFKMKNVGGQVKEWLLKKTGQTKLQKITKQQFEEVLTSLEQAATAELAAAVLKS